MQLMQKTFEAYSFDELSESIQEQLIQKALAAAWECDVGLYLETVSEEIDDILSVLDFVLPRHSDCTLDVDYILDGSDRDYARFMRPIQWAPELSDGYRKGHYMRQILLVDQANSEVLKAVVPILERLAMTMLWGVEQAHYEDGEVSVSYIYHTPIRRKQADMDWDRDQLHTVFEAVNEFVDKRFCGAVQSICSPEYQRMDLRDKGDWYEKDGSLIPQSAVPVAP